MAEIADDSGDDAMNMPPKPAERAGDASAKALNAVDPSRRSKVLKRAQNTPVSARLGYLRAASGQAAPRAAIKAQCLECLGWDRVAVRECTDPACPLWAYRPFQANESEDPAESEALRLSGERHEPAESTQAAGVGF